MAVEELRHQPEAVTTASAVRHRVRVGAALARELAFTDVAMAREAAEAAFTALQATDPATWDDDAVDCLHALGEARHRSGAPEEATGPLLEAIDVFHRTGGPDRAPLGAHRLHASLSIAYCSLSLHAQALSESCIALGLAEEADDPTALCWTWGDLAWVHLHLGDAEQAEEAADRAVAAGERPGADAMRLALAHVHGLLSCARRGRIQAAEAHADAARALAGALGPADHAGLLVAVAELDLLRSNVDAALAHFSEALEVAMPGGPGTRPSPPSPAGPAPNWPTTIRRRPSSRSNGRWRSGSARPPSPPGASSSPPAPTSSSATRLRPWPGTSGTSARNDRRSGPRRPSGCGRRWPPSTTPRWSAGPCSTGSGPSATGP